MLLYIYSVIEQQRLQNLKLSVNKVIYSTIIIMIKNNKVKIEIN